MASSSINAAKLSGGQDGTNGTDGINDLVLISSAQAVADTSVEFTGLNSSYSKYVLTFASANRNTLIDDTLILRTSSDNGSTWDSGASDYQWIVEIKTGGGNNVTESTADGEIYLTANNATHDLGGLADEQASGYIEIFNPASEKYTSIVAQISYISGEPSPCNGVTSGVRSEAAAVNGIQISLLSGGAFYGLFKLYGLKAT